MSTLAETQHDIKAGSVALPARRSSFSHLLDRFKQTRIWMTLANWEFWPFWAVYFPVGFYWTWLSIKARSFFFFTASNPSIQFGGLLGEKKSDVFDLIPEDHIPKTILLKPNTSAKKVTALMKQHHLDYPIILKPDIGERGWMVEKINNEKELRAYLARIEVDFLLQEFVDLPVEMGVFYYRQPNESNGHISSIVLKKMLQVTGDGQHTVEQLMQADFRAIRYLEQVRHNQNQLLQYVPEHGETMELVPIGNHCKGTTFLNGNHLISRRLERIFDELSHQIEGFYFGRFDIRGTSYNAIEAGDFKVLELNGAGSEPGHIYQPGTSLIEGYKGIFFHLRKLYEISVANHRLGVPYASLQEGWQQLMAIRRYNKQKKDELV